MGRSRQTDATAMAKESVITKTKTRWILERGGRVWIRILRLWGVRRISMDLNGFKMGGPGSFCMVDFLSDDDRCQDFSNVFHVEQPKHAMVHAVDTLEVRVMSRRGLVVAKHRYVSHGQLASHKQTKYSDNLFAKD
jgi:hypothetical protein